jgi:hypothetical protein
VRLISLTLGYKGYQERAMLPPYEAPCGLKIVPDVTVPPNEVWFCTPSETYKVVFQEDKARGSSDD